MFLNCISTRFYVIARTGPYGSWILILRSQFEGKVVGFHARKNYDINFFIVGF